MKWTIEDALEAGRAWVVIHKAPPTTTELRSANSLPGHSEIYRLFGSAVQYQKEVMAETPDYQPAKKKVLAHWRKTRQRDDNLRQCLRCDASFKSEGIWNRICPTCKDVEWHQPEEERVDSSWMTGVNVEQGKGYRRESHGLRIPL